MRPDQQTIKRWRKIDSLSIRFLWRSTTTEEQLYTTVDALESGEIPEDFDGTPMELCSIEVATKVPINPEPELKYDPDTGDSSVRF